MDPWLRAQSRPALVRLSALGPHSNSPTGPVQRMIGPAIWPSLEDFAFTQALHAKLVDSRWMRPYNAILAGTSIEEDYTAIAHFQGGSIRERRTVS
jgi:hypothetical protein